MAHWTSPRYKSHNISKISRGLQRYRPEPLKLSLQDKEVMAEKLQTGEMPLNREMRRMLAAARRGQSST